MKQFIRFPFTAFLAATLLFTTACNIPGKDSKASDKSLTEVMAERPDIIGLYPAQVSYVGDIIWGYINDTGKFIIKPVFSEANEFQSNGLAAVAVDEKYGLINEKGDFVVKPQYSYIDNFNDGRAIATNDDGFRVIDENGSVVFGPESFIGSYSDERAAFYRQGSSGKLEYGYIDTSGKIVVKPQFEYANSFSNGLAVVRTGGGGYAIIDKGGTILKTFNYNYLGNYSNGLLAFQEVQDGKYGYINEKGVVIIKPQYTNAWDFKDGRGVVNTSTDPVINKYGLIDEKGKFIVQPLYNDILILGEGMLALGIPINKDYSYIGSKYAVAGPDGKPLTDFIFYGADNYVNGITSVYDNDSTYFIDKKGKRVTTLPRVEGSGTMQLLNDLVKVDVDSRLYYLNREGNTAYKPAECAKLEIGVTVCEAKYKPNRNYLVYYPQLRDIADKEVENSINSKLKNMTIKSGITSDMELDYSYQGEFNTAFNQKVLLVINMNAYNFPFGAAHGMPFKNYVHINVKSGRFYELKDLFKAGSNYTKELSDIVGRQINQHGEEMGVWPDSYKGIAEDQPFFITKDALNLYFDPYEIAPYAAGFPTFRIPFNEISDIIRKDGGFWLSFN
jgi:KWG Leptospira./Protein of unknown function (DUF3298).